MYFWQILDYIIRISQVFVVLVMCLGLIVWFVLVKIYYRHRTEQYWYRLKFIPKKIRDELYKLNPLNVTEADTVFPRILIHGFAFKRAVNKKTGEEGKLTFYREDSSLLTCNFLAYQTSVKGTHEEDKENIWISKNGITGLLSKLYGDIFSPVLRGKLHFFINKEEKDRDAYFTFTGKDITREIKWTKENCDICFLERAGMLVFLGKNKQKNIQFFFRCLPDKFYYNKRYRCRKQFVLRFNSRLFVYILRFYGWDGEFYKDYGACKKDREEEKKHKK